ncbi:MAG: AI-2E family transporter [Planctomycetota bacterium]
MKEWWLIGDDFYALWAQAESNFEATLNRYDDQVQYVGQQALSLAGNSIATVFQFVFALILAGALFLFAAGGYRTTQSIANKLVGKDQGKAMTDMAIGTVRSVFKGVLGVAAIQALASAAGLAIAGIPGAGLWAGAILVVAIVQLPPLLIIGPIAIWYFSVADTVPAVVFLVFAVVVSVSDSFLKPLLLGRGLKTPMLVILLGAIGGALSMGIVGLFIGAVVLAVGYELLSVWMGNKELEESPAPANS